MKLAALVLAGVLAVTADAKFFVTGLVKRPGAYKFPEKSLTVGEAIETAGGFSKLADMPLVILRKIDGKDTRIEVTFAFEMLPSDVLCVGVRC